MISGQDIKDLRYAKQLLENPSLAARMTLIIGAPVEKGLDLLPKGWKQVVQKASAMALQKALRFATMTMKHSRPGVPAGVSAERAHKWMVAGSGCLGGAFGLPALFVELPVSTTIMLRSIADIARSEGESLALPETGLACLQVFALGGRSPRDKAAETGYFALRTILAQSLSEAAQYIAAKGLTQEGAPVIVRFIGQIASRFGIAVTEKAAAQALPAAGALGGAAINTIFLDHFQKMARGHFIVRRLERVHGQSEVRTMYERL
jgi:hypothetical protein